MKKQNDGLNENKTESNEQYENQAANFQEMSQSAEVPKLFQSKSQDLKKARAEGDKFQFARTQINASQQSGQSRNLGRRYKTQQKKRTNVVENEDGYGQSFNYYKNKPFGYRSQTQIKQNKKQQTNNISIRNYSYNIANDHFYTQQSQIERMEKGRKDKDRKDKNKPHTQKPTAFMNVYNNKVMGNKNMKTFSLNNSVQQTTRSRRKIKKQLDNGQKIIDQTTEESVREEQLSFWDKVSVSQKGLAVEQNNRAKSTNMNQRNFRNQTNQKFYYSNNFMKIGDNEINSVIQARKIRLQKEQNVAKLQTRIAILKKEDEKANKLIEDQIAAANMRLLNRLEKQDIREQRDKNRDEFINRAKNIVQNIEMEKQNIKINQLQVVLNKNELVQSVKQQKVRNKNITYLQEQEFLKTVKDRKFEFHIMAEASLQISVENGTDAATKNRGQKIGQF